jgi:hypothetical protein
VIDNQDQVERLLRNLTEVLPLSALATPAIAREIAAYQKHRIKRIRRENRENTTRAPAAHH